MSNKLKVHKMKCNECEAIFLVEKSEWWKEDLLACPVCCDIHEVYHLKDVTITELNKKEVK